MGTQSSACTLAESTTSEESLEEGGDTTALTMKMHFNTNKHLRHFLAEFLGTFCLVLIGDGAVAQFALSENPNSAANKGGNFIHVAFGYGLALMVGICVSGGVSGGHLNPAVTLAMAVGKLCRRNCCCFSWRRQHDTSNGRHFCLLPFLLYWAGCPLHLGSRPDPWHLPAADHHLCRHGRAQHEHQRQPGAPHHRPWTHSNTSQLWSECWVSRQPYKRFLSTSLHPHRRLGGIIFGSRPLVLDPTSAASHRSRPRRRHLRHHDKRSSPRGINMISAHHPEE